MKLRFTSLIRKQEPGCYVIWRKPPGAGFWSNFTFVLQGLHEAEALGLPAVVDMQNFRTIYSENKPINGTSNVWEYYFEPVSTIGLDDAKKNTALYRPANSAGIFIRTPIPVPDEVMQQCRYLVSTYIRPKKDILSELEQLLSNEPPSEVLGIHLRGTDARAGIYPNHSVPDVPEAYLEKARRLDAKHKYRSIYLATDEQAYVEMFANVFGKKLLYQRDAWRSVNSNPGWEETPNRENHLYKLGKEVLLDVLALSRCGHFLCGQSTVSHAVLMFSPRPPVFHYMEPIWTKNKSTADKLVLSSEPDAEDKISVLLAQRKELYRLLAAAEQKKPKKKFFRF